MSASITFFDGVDKMMKRDNISDIVPAEDR